MVELLASEVYMDKYKYKFSIKLYVLMGLGFLLAVACFIWNVIRIFRLIEDGITDAYTIISVSVAILMSIAFVVIISALLVDSSYVFEQNNLVIKFGFIKNVYSYKDIKQLVWFKSNNKLTIYFKDESFLTVVIEEKDYLPFANSLTQKNEKVVYYEDINTESK